MPNVIGIDPSLKRTAVFVLDEAGQFVSRRCFPSQSIGSGIKARVARNQAVGRSIRDFLTPLVPVVIAFEGYSFSAKGAGHHDIIEHGYELRRMLCALEPLPRFLEVPPSNVKKHASGHGHAEKAMMVTKMARRFPDLDFETDDEADAAALSIIALQAAGFEQPVNAVQAEQLDTILNGKPKKPRRQKQESF